MCVCLLTEWGFLRRDGPQSGAGNRLESEPSCPDSLISSLIHGLTAGSTRAHTHRHRRTHTYTVSSKVQNERKEYIQSQWHWHQLVSLRDDGSISTFLASHPLLGNDPLHFTDPVVLNTPSPHSNAGIDLILSVVNDRAKKTYHASCC